MEIEKGDYVKLNEKLTIETLWKEYWGGCLENIIMVIKDNPEEMKVYSNKKRGGIGGLVVEVVNDFKLYHGEETILSIPERFLKLVRKSGYDFQLWSQEIEWLNLIDTERFKVLEIRGSHVITFDEEFKPRYIANMRNYATMDFRELEEGKRYDIERLKRCNTRIPF